MTDQPFSGWNGAWGRDAISSATREGAGKRPMRDTLIGPDRPDLGRCRSALLHHWLLEMGGAERVSEAISDILGSPDIFCIVGDRSKLSPALQRCRMNTSFVQRMPFAKRRYRQYAMMFPLAVELFDLRPYDLVVSSDASVVKGAITQPEACHVCYCHTPMRYAWHMFQEYMTRAHGIRRTAFVATMRYLRSFDQTSAARVDHFVANSRAVRNRIRRYYGRDAEVIYPPCDTGRFQIGNRVADYYLCVSRLVEYKRVDVAVKAFNMNGRRLIVAGDGPERKRLESMGQRNVEFLGRVTDDALARLYAQCQALVFPAEEDFGIVPVEAQASGRPVIAYAKGGALETVVPRRTGLFFEDQTAEALNQAVNEFEAKKDVFHPQEIRQAALRFSTERFKEAFQSFLAECWEEHVNGLRSKLPRD
jgi:glycosyltransferase involved in cell wall biosynthesis